MKETRLPNPDNDRHRAWEDVTGTQPTPHDWFSEAKGLGYMILRIHADYVDAKEHMNGDSEFLRQSVYSAYRYVDTALRSLVEAELEKPTKQARLAKNPDE